MSSKVLALFTGPPGNPKKDKEAIELFLSLPGKKAICGGTTAQIIARQFKTDIKIDLAAASADIPPAGSIEGLDLISEGRITLNKTLMLLEAGLGNNSAGPAGDLARLICESDHIHIFSGGAFNPLPEKEKSLNRLSEREEIIRNLYAFLKAKKRTVTLFEY